MPTHPSDPGTERALIGAAILDPIAVAQMAPLAPEAFHVPAHRTIWGGILALAGRDWTVASLKASLGADCTDAVRTALQGAESSTFSAGGLDELAGRLRDLHLRRRLADIGARACARAADFDADGAEIVADVESELLALTHRAGPASVTYSRDCVGAAMVLLQAAQDGTEGAGVPFGVPDLDRMTTGMRAGEVWLIASRPGIGKSALAAQSLVAASAAGIRSLLVSLEMTRAEIGVRMLCSEAKVDQRRARTPGALTDYDMGQLNAHALRIAALPFHVDDGFAAGIAEVRSIAHGIKAKHPDLGFVVIDYLQLMGGDRSRQSNREQEIAGISRGLKMLAKDLNLPVLALSQLSRDMEKGKRRPQLSDLRESGSLEQDASGVVFIYRDQDAKPQGDTGIFAQEVIVAKQRNGPLGSIDVAFESRFTRFVGMARGER